MDESAPIRAIVIGVSTLLAIATISAVLMYYNTAKQMASNVGKGQDFAENYEKSIQDILTNAYSTVAGNNNYITGADVKNLLNYFYMDETVQIDINNIKYINDDDGYNGYIPNVKTISLNGSSINNSEGDYPKAMKYILESQKFTINRSDNVELSNGRQGMKISLVGVQ